MSWHWRNALRESEVTISVDCPRLREEGRKTKYMVTSAGKIQIESKDRIRERLGRSPDALDAVIYGWHAMRNHLAGPARPLRVHADAEYNQSSNLPLEIREAEQELLQATRNQRRRRRKGFYE